MHMTRLVLQLAAILITARIFGLLFERYAKQPRVLGEIVAGMIIGPYALGGLALPFVNSPLFPAMPGNMPVSSELYAIATIASIVLLFRAGLETDLSMFLRYSVVGSLVALGGVIVSFIFGAGIAVLCGKAESFMDPVALLLGTISTATSVGLTARILSERRKMSSPEGVTILAGAVLDDVLGIIILAVVVGIAKLTTGGGEIAWGKVAIIAGKAFGFWLAFTVFGILMAPRITRALKLFRSNDAVAVVVFGLALFFAGLSERAGLAMIIGAYVTGLSLSQTDMAHELCDRLNGIYGMLVPVFFCVMGMMVNFVELKGAVLFGLAYSAVAILGKVIGCGLPALGLGFNMRGAFRIAAGMLPRGEVTMIIAGIGLSSGIITSELFSVAVMTLFVASIIAPPILINSFKGGSGVRSQLADKRQESLKHIELEFPRGVLQFMRLRLEQAFRNEEFFVHRIESNGEVCQIRKEDIVITLTVEDGRIILTTAAKNEQLVRLLVLEEVLELKDLLESVEKMKKPDSMGHDLLAQMFTGDSD